MESPAGQIGGKVRVRTIPAAVVIAVALVVAVPSLAGGQESPGDSTSETTANTIDDVQVCDVSYPTLCIPPAPPDLDCEDIVERNFPVRPPDPHGLDGNDNDGIGCEDEHDGEPAPPPPPPAEEAAPPAAPAAPVTAEPDFTG
jgi:hypothetical protein